MTREELERAALEIIVRQGAMHAAQNIIALVVEACCENLREGGADIVHRAFLRDTFLPPKDPSNG